METRKVMITTTRQYFKTTTIEVEVDVNIKDDELVDHLTENFGNEIEEGIASASLSGGDDIYEFQDPTNDFGGHL